MAPPDLDNSPCTCLFGNSKLSLRVEPGSRAKSLYQESYAEYVALMKPVWDEVGTSDWSHPGDPYAEPSEEFFKAVLTFDARMRTQTKVPPLIDELVREYAYLDARKATVKPDYYDTD